jgi:D-lactate dehydrogenase (cytochrome)
MTKSIKEIDKLFLKLIKILGDRFSTDLPSKEEHSADESYHNPQLPDAVATVHTTEEVAKIIKLCAEHHCPIIPFGAGTSLATKRFTLLCAFLNF